MYIIQVVYTRALYIVWPCQCGRWWAFVSEIFCTMIVRRVFHKSKWVRKNTHVFEVRFFIRFRNERKKREDDSLKSVDELWLRRKNGSMYTWEEIHYNLLGCWWMHKKLIPQISSRSLRLLGRQIGIRRKSSFVSQQIGKFLQPYKYHVRLSRELIFFWKLTAWNWTRIHFTNSIWKWCL